MPKSFSRISRIHALSLLSLCDGDEIWSCEYCREKRVPEDWIALLRDVFESDFSESETTIYQDGQRLSQYEGVRAVDIAVQLAANLGIRVDPHLLSDNQRSLIVAWIQQRAEED